MKEFLKGLGWFAVGGVVLIVYLNLDSMSRSFAGLFAALAFAGWQFGKELDKIRADLNTRLVRIEDRLAQIESRQMTDYVHNGMHEFVAEREQQRRDTRDAELLARVHSVLDGAHRG